MDAIVTVKSPMRRVRPNNIALCLLAGVLLCSCGKVRDGYSFMSAQECTADGEYVFKVDFSDTTLIYSTFIAARLSAKILTSDALPLEITVTSPSGEICSERFDFPLRDSGGKVASGRAEGGLLDVEWPYRDNIELGSALSEPGLWAVSILPLVSDRKAVYGMGFRYTAD